MTYDEKHNGLMKRFAVAQKMYNQQIRDLSIPLSDSPPHSLKPTDLKIVVELREAKEALAEFEKNNGR